ncbi:hypothetical protein BpHYR1_050970 [Brachionus plicatilis]|uniref:Uncharacterized protein n=1 Tax=Brachionus plicatilis TaxID=10195 RepID=A0A3M7QXN4_BRAPC|nr:hypothetical protein BpHYR1_050970 [Brachionus plicatilis]
MVFKKTTTNCKIACCTIYIYAQLVHHTNILFILFKPNRKDFNLLFTSRNFSDIFFNVFVNTQFFEWDTQLTSSSGLNHKAISRSALSTESEPWQMLRPVWTQKSPRMLPGLLSCGLVSPNMTRPALTAFKPDHTMATTGPLTMYCIKLGKNGLAAKSW